MVPKKAVKKVNLHILGVCGERIFTDKLGLSQNLGVPWFKMCPFIHTKIKF